ncbi:uncharacterized protein LOC110456800 [Mizuhopecten yessoensis]|uniref:uncharacterized protein LOC110456800 n=1 Tax=Mizuhopecten yessoensis TaxID=6573 RepID=UPI000B45CBE3|nr:uncharacterized protein LOC110456800 [Mizuhopecten yessoensis]
MLRKAVYERIKNVWKPVYENLQTVIKLRTQFAFFSNGLFKSFLLLNFVFRFSDFHFCSVFLYFVSDLDIWILHIATMVVIETCVFCLKSFDDDEPTSQLREKGSESINLVSRQTGDTIIASPGQRVHQGCCRDFIHPRSLKPTTGNVSITPKRSLRSTTPDFDLREHCLFCGKPAKVNERKRGHDVFPVRTTEFKNNLEAKCMTRNDEWAEEVLGRLQIAPADLHAADAVYHQSCSVNFRTGKMMPLSKSSYNDIKRVPLDDLKRHLLRMLFLKLLD